MEDVVCEVVDFSTELSKAFTKDGNLRNEDVTT
jgi:hypothetical protein